MVHLDVGSVPVFWNHKSCLALDQEEYTGDVIPFKEYVLLLREEGRLEERTNPGDEG